MKRTEEIKNTAMDYLYGGIINAWFDGYMDKSYIEENRDQILQDCYEYCTTHRTIVGGGCMTTYMIDNRHVKLASKDIILQIADEILRSEGL